MADIELRELHGKDIFPVLSIVGKLNIKEDIVALFKGESAEDLAPQDHKKKKLTKKEQEEREAAIESRGIEIVANLIQRVLLNAGKVEAEINSLLADLSGKSKKEIDELSLDDYADLLIAFFKKPELLGFIKRLVSFFK